MPCGEGTSLHLSELCLPASARFVVTNLTSPTPSLCLATSSCAPCKRAKASPFLSVHSYALCGEP